MKNASSPMTHPGVLPANVTIKLISAPCVRRAGVGQAIRFPRPHFRDALPAGSINSLPCRTTQRQSWPAIPALEATCFDYSGSPAAARSPIPMGAAAVVMPGCLLVLRSLWLENVRRGSQFLLAIAQTSVSLAWKIFKQL
jgi:hypothetical protein